MAPREGPCAEGTLASASRSGSLFLAALRHPGYARLRAALLEGPCPRGLATRCPPSARAGSVQMPYERDLAAMAGEVLDQVIEHPVHVEQALGAVGASPRDLPREIVVAQHRSRAPELGATAGQHVVEELERAPA